MLPLAVCAALRQRAMTAWIANFKENTMSKMKTKRSAAKRFGVTGSGKFRRRRQNLRHILTKKSAKRKMRLGQGAIVDSANAGAVRRMLPYA